MKHFLSIILMAGCLWSSAQVPGKKISYVVLGNYQSLATESFFGPTFEFNVRLGQSDHLPHFALGMRTGILITRSKGEGGKDRFLYEDQGYYATEETKGHVFLMPFEGYLLVGSGEDFLEVGGGLTWAQFEGERRDESQNRRQVYEVRGFNLLPTLQLGYLHRPRDSGIMFRVQWKPTWNLAHETFENGMAVGLGYAF